MAKKSRMGRNLDALLGGVQRNRSATSKDDVSSDDGMAVDFDQTGAATPGIEATPTTSVATPRNNVFEITIGTGGIASASQCQ